MIDPERVVTEMQKAIGTEYLVIINVDSSMIRVNSPKDRLINVELENGLILAEGENGDVLIDAGMVSAIAKVYKDDHCEHCGERDD